MSRDAKLISVTDEELTDAWLAGRRFESGVTHEQHVRIAWVLHRRFGPKDAEALLIAGTRRACEVHGCPEKFDRDLTIRWSREVARLVARDGPADSAADFIAAHPQLRRTDLSATAHD